MTLQPLPIRRVNQQRLRGRRRRLLCACMTSDYGRPERGFGYEYYNFLPTFERMPLDVRQFDFVAAVVELGYWGAAAELRRLVLDWDPDVLICFMYQEQLSRDVVRWVSAETETTTVAWFSDDHWRFDNYSRHWANAFNWVLTTDECAVDKYRALGQQGVIRTQWGCNELLYRPTGRPLQFDVTFVGAAYGRRRAVIDCLVRHGIPVSSWGAGWPQGRLSQTEMIEAFSTSRINLNLSASSRQRRWRRSDDRDLQIKGRVFEVPSCGGLLLTDAAPRLEEYFIPDREIVVFDGIDDLLVKTQSLLANEHRRSAIANAGYERTMRDHTYLSRMNSIFAEIGLLPASPGVRNG